MKKSDLEKAKILVIKKDTLEKVISNFIINGSISLNEFVNFIQEQRRFDIGAIRSVELTEEILILIKEEMIKQNMKLEKELNDLGVSND